jgi:mannosylglycerate hydrolase
MKESKFKKVIIVSHTHWDREWYQPFQEYRLRLIKTLDKLLNILQNDPEFKHFLLDGQVIALEDYLELRPEKKDILLRYIKEGRISIGPWYTQPDEWLSHSESLVRNLLIAKITAEKLNLPLMRIGYTPDSFGHTAQLPQILNGFDIDSFIFMRGLGDEGERLGTEFIWSAPDKTKVIAVYLLTSYSNGIFLGSLVGHPHTMYYGDIYPKTIKIWKSDDLKVVTYFGIYEKEPIVSADKASEQINWLMEQTIGKTKSSTLLILNGADHAPPQESLSKIIKEVRKYFPATEIIHGKLEDYVRQLYSIAELLSTFEGELRGARYHWMTTNTISTRIPQIKYPNYLSQTIVIYYLEPLMAFCWLLGEQYHHNIINHIWKLILRNLAHDSICGCSVDEVIRDVNSRFRHAIEISKNLIYDKLDFLANQINTSKLGDAESYIVVFNPLNWKRTDKVKLHTELPTGRYIILDEDGSEVPINVERVYSQEIFMKKKVAELIFVAKDIPPLGYKTYRVRYLSSDIKEPITISKTTIENEFFRVQADPNNGGSLRILDKLTNTVYEGFNTLIDEGDAGDEYTFSPPEEQTIFTSKYVPADVQVNETSSYSCLNINFTMRIPKCLDGQKRSKELVDLPVSEKVYLYPNIPRIDVHITVNNKAMDHRLRVSFPTGIKAKHSTADMHFYVAERPTIPPTGKGWQESPAVDHPQIYWVDVSDGSRGIMVANQGLPEYKLDSDGTLYLTLLRCVGYLFKNELATRPGVINLSVPTPEAQCIGCFNFQYSIIPHRGNWCKDAIFREALNFTIPPLAILTNKHEGKLNTKCSLLSLEPNNLIVTAVKKAEKEDSLIIRFYNASKEASKASINLGLLTRFAKSIWQAKLSEENIKQLKLNNKIDIDVKPCEIVTLKFGRK